MIVGIRMAPAANGTRAGRAVHLISLIASTVLHASVVAAVIYGVLGTAVSPPEPLVVELVSRVGTATPGSSATEGQQAPAAGAGEARQDEAERAPLEAQHSVHQSPKMSSVEPEPPVSRPRSVAKKVPQAPKQVRPADPAPETPPAPVAEPTMPTEDAVSPSDDRVPSDGSLVASLGAAGAAREASGSSGRPNRRPSTEAGDDGSTRGPGFSLGGAGNPMPRYPPAARRRGIEGKVVLDVLVSAEGQALSVAIARSSGSSLLDEAARETIGRWRFRPAIRRDKAVEARATVPVQFSLVEPSP